MSQEMTVDQAIQIALSHQRAGQLAQAEELFHQILAAYPDQADALHLLGGVYLQARRLDLAEARVLQAIRIRPEPTFGLTLGLILQGSNRLDEAVAHYQKLIASKPDYVEAYVHLGVVYSLQGKFEEAEKVFQEAVRLNPRHPVAKANLGLVLCHLKRWDDATWVLREAIAANPRDAGLHAAIGAALYHKRQFEAALASCQDALKLNPKLAQAHNVMSLIYKALGRDAEAAEAAKQASALLPESEEVLVNLGEGLRATGKLDEAAAHYKKAIARFPTNGDFHNNLANIYKDVGLLDEAIAEYGRAIALKPSPHYFSNYLYTLLYHPAYTAERYFEEAKRYDALVSAPVKNERPASYPNARDPAKRLRIGYLSNEFRQHALGLNLLPLITRHDKSQFEIFIYSEVLQPDFYTFRLRQFADKWQDVHGISDADLAALVRRDEIDIFVDLHQHIAGNRLPVYARKPAPVQIGFAGFPNTTGLSTIDYRLTDPYLEPVDGPEQPSSETPLRLPHSFWCYHPAVETPINDLPALQNGYLTFGNLNNFCKLNDGVYDLWIEIMAAFPHSQLLLLAPPGAHRDRVKDYFDGKGIARDRVRFSDRLPSGDYYKLYHTIDLSLDSFPCNGHTTSMDSFFMGVPVTTIIGDRLFGRATWSQLSNLGFPELAGRTPAEFVALSIALAKDLPRLAELRRTLRDRMKGSPLMDDAGFAKGVESAYRDAWRRYCTAP
jgi:predicted O-linked N-acetylglucosamine transferase (SPINDLY family)